MEQDPLHEATRAILAGIRPGTAPLDPGILPLVDALNRLPGLRTESSCGGHPDRHPYVLLKTDGSERAMAGLCLVAHALKSYGWKLQAVPIGSVGDLTLRFVAVPGQALKDWQPDQAVFGVRAADPESVRAGQASIESIAGRIATLRLNSRFVPEPLD